MSVTKIQWTATILADGTEIPGYTFNPWIGCAKVHAGCTNCYAEADMAIRRKRVIWGANGTRSITSDAYWKQPVKWNREAETSGIRRKVFCASLADVFEDRDELLSWREELFDLIDATPFLDWLLLTKRPKNIRRMWIDPHPEISEFNSTKWYRSNVWLGTSVSDQSTADKAIPELLKCRDLSPVFFLSCEPLLSPIDLTRLKNGNGETYDSLKAEVTTRDAIDWVIVGGESGSNARSCRQTWIQDIVRQCEDANVACFVKQFGSNAEEGPGVHRKLLLKDKKGGDPSEWPEYLRVRQFPEVAR